MYRSCFFSFLLLCCGIVNAQSKQLTQQLDQLLSQGCRPTEPGCEVLVARKGEIIYHKAFGSANLELNVPLTNNMVFKLASVTKQFTAIAILQLAEQGKLSLQDSVQKYVPGFPYKGHTITIEHLLTHTSGIKDYMQIDYRQPNMERWDFTPAILIDSFKYFPLQFAPGTMYEYSNSGYFLLGYIIQQVAGTSYQSYVQQHLLTPLALSHTYFDSAGIIIPNRVSGYKKEGNLYKNADYWSSTIAYAAGGLLSNTEDLYTWMKGVLSYKLIKKETLDKAFTAYKLANGSVTNYGYGWYIHSMDAIPSIEHSGKMNGFITNVTYYPQQDVFIAALFNNEDAPKDKLCNAMAELVLGKPLQTATALSLEQLDAYTGVYALSTDGNRTITISRKGNTLYAKVSGQSSFELLFQSPVTFQLKDVKDMTGEFIKEHGVVTKMMVQQNGLFEWRKVK